MKLAIADSAWESLTDITDYWSGFKTHERIVQRVDELWDAVDRLLEHPRAGEDEGLTAMSKVPQASA